MIKQFQVIIAKTVFEFEKKVKDALEDGWNICGSMCYDSHSCEPYRIAMIRELPENYYYDDENDSQ